MRCPTCGSKKIEDISFFKQNSYFCKKCNIVFYVVISDLTDIHRAIVKAYINEYKKKGKIYDKVAQTKA